MILNGRLIQRTFVVSILMVLISLGMVGIVAADNDTMDCCRQLAVGNETAGYWPGMMGSTGVQMMESVEVSAMGNEMHDEMQGLVTKMIAGNLSSSDQARMVEIMNRYPGASNMMVTRMTGGTVQGGWSGYQGMMGGAGMMGSGFMVLGVSLAVLFYVVWLAVGILLIIWLVTQLQKEKKQP